MSEIVLRADSRFVDMDWTNMNLGVLNSEDLWRLPYVGIVHDDRNSNIETIKSFNIDVALAKRIHSRTKMPLKVARELTQIAQFSATFNEDNRVSKPEYERYVAIILREADRYLAVADLLRTGNKSMPNIVQAYVDETLDPNESPKAFLLRKVRGSIIFFALMGFFGVLASRIKPGSGLDRTGCLVIVGIITGVGVLSYGHMFSQFKARKQLTAFLGGVS